MTDQAYGLINTVLNAAMLVLLIIAMRRQQKYIKQEKANAGALETIKSIIRDVVRASSRDGAANNG